MMKSQLNLRPGFTLLTVLLTGSVLYSHSNKAVGILDRLNKWIESFSLKTNEQDVYVEWHTLDEEGMTAIMVERSLNGLDFGRVAKIAVSSQSQSGNSYLYVDRKVRILPTEILYYRLSKIGSKDKEVGPIESIQLKASAKAAAALHRDPNDGRIRLEYYPPNSGILHLYILNSLGKELSHQRLKTGDGLSKMEIDASAWPVGVYYISLVQDSFKQVQKVIVD